MRRDETVRFVFRLALHLGRSVAELFETVSARELIAWQHYYAMEPFGQIRGDLQAGQIASVICNMFRGKGKKPITPGDFIMRFDKEEKPDDPRKTFAAMAMMAAAMKGASNGRNS